MSFTVAQIDAAYQAVLQRLPTDAEVIAAQSLDAAIGDNGVLAAIIDSPDAQQNVYPIIQIILQQTESAAAAIAQFPALVSAVESGSTSLDQLALPFVASIEFAREYNGGTLVDPNAPITAPIVSKMIQYATGVAATPDHISSWVSTGLSIEQVFVAFVQVEPSDALAQSGGNVGILWATWDILRYVAENESFWGPIDYILPNDNLTAAQVQGAYEAVLQRAPSGAETNAALWIDSSTLGGHGNVAALAVIVDSPEAQHNVYPVVQIIELATGNLPTAAQLSGWVSYVESAGLLQGQLQTDPLLDQMAEAFVGSTQFGNVFNGGTAVDPNTPITASILSAIIQAATGRATQEKVNSWLATGLTIDQVFVDFALCDHYAAHLQGTAQNLLIAMAINGAGLSTVDGSFDGAVFTLGTVQTPLTGNDLTIQGDSVVATGDGDTITATSNVLAPGNDDTISGRGIIIASGNYDTISVGGDADTITASGSGDTINLGVVGGQATSITTAQTVHASGAGDTITFATTAVDTAAAITWSSASTVDGDDNSTGIGANSTVNFGNNTGNGSETIVLTGDLTGATTQGGTSTSGIAMTTLGNVHNAAGDLIVLNNATSEVLAGGGAVNVTAASSLAQAFDIAAAHAAASQSGGKIAAHTGVIDWFQYGGNTYVLEANNSTGNAATHSALAATDELVKIVGLVNLSGETLSGHTLTL